MDPPKRSTVGEKRIKPSYKYWPYLCKEILGSSASLKSRSKPRDWRELRKMECEDLIARSSSKTRIRRSVGRSGEKELQSVARNGIAVRKINCSVDIVGSLGLRALQIFPTHRDPGLVECLFLRSSGVCVFVF